MLPVALSTQLLVQFLVAVSGAPDASAATLSAAERAAAALEAEVAAVLIEGEVVAIGFPRGQVPYADLAAVAARTSTSLVVPGLGPCPAMAAPLGRGADGFLVLARQGADFTAEESSLLRGMAQTLQLVLDMQRTLDAERSLLHSLEARHALLEQLLDLQRAISRRAPLQQVLDSVVAGAHTLLGAEVAGLCLLEAAAGVPYVHVPSQGSAVPAGDARRLSTQAVLAGGVVIEGSAGARRSAMAAPVHEGGRAVGALVVGSVSAGRSWTDAEAATLAAFAEHVSLAVTDARTLEDMRQAHHDALTGLATRRLFMQQLQAALDEAARRGTVTAVLFLDLDRFKMVNDTLGHSAGDELLVAVSQRLRGCLRATDAAARLGGDEFAVLLEDIGDLAVAHAIAERMREAVQWPVVIAGHEVFVDASIGLRSVGPGDSARDAEGMLRDADVAMYDAKRTGAGRTAVFESRMLERFETRVRLEADLRQAVERDDLVLHYQPILDLATGRVEGVEALVRWQHPRRGLVPPMDFIPLAEETGLIVALGERVLRRACGQAAAWGSAFPDGTAPYVSVNLSGRQLAQPGLVAQVERALTDARLQPSLLVLEITESMLVRDDDGVLERLRALKALGVRLAVDDFGSGYSSLGYLRAFPIDILKLDKSFVDAIATDESAADLAKAVVNLGAALRLRTIAEGVESEEQRRVLELAGCSAAQGFLFSRPVTASVCTELLGIRSVTAQPA